MNDKQTDRGCSGLNVESRCKNFCKGLPFIKINDFSFSKWVNFRMKSCTCIMTNRIQMHHFKSCQVQKKIYISSTFFLIFYLYYACYVKFSSLNYFEISYKSRLPLCLNTFRKLNNNEYCQ